MENLAEALRAGLAARADPARAGPMQRYMRSTMPFRGVPKPARTQLLRELVDDRPPPSPTEFAAAVRDLWERARFREERYLAIALTGLRRWSPQQDASWLTRYERWLRDGAWWDFTDEIAPHRVGPLLRADPDRIGPVLRDWMVDPDRWLRRAAVIAQLGSRAGTDLDLLAAAIDANVADRDVFLRRAVGWALRTHSRVDPDWVRAFVAARPELAPVSRREALRHMN